MNRRKSGSVRAWGLCALAILMALCAPAWAYKQDYLYEDRGSWRNVQVATGEHGSTYFMLYDEAGENSYIYKVPEEFSGRRADLEGGGPLMKIPGRAVFEITTDEKTTYVYYTLAGDKTHLYRQRLVAGGNVGQPDVRDFTLEGSPFVFTGFALAEDPDQILLASRENAQKEVTIGLFSFSNWSDSGANEPIRTWTCTLPEERKYKPAIDGEVGYSVVYEASTDSVWLVVQQSYFGERQSNIPKWYFYSPLGQGGVLQAFDPAEEIPKWNESSNFKVFSVKRYRRIVEFMDTAYPSLGASAIAVYEVSGGKTILSEQVDSWTAPGGNWDVETKRPLKEFWSRGRDAVNNYSCIVDSLGNLYVKFSASDHSGNASFVRMACFTPERIIENVAPDPAKDGRKQPANAIVLDALPFKGPEGYLATGSRWEVYRKTDGIRGASSIRGYEDQEPVYEGRNTDGSPSHRLTKALPAGDYVWRMAYNWLIEGEGGMFGSTRWSKLGSFTAVESPTPTPTPEPQPSPGPKPTPKPNPRTSKDKSGGGCDAGLGGLALLLAVSQLLKKKA
ncbi:hypothetical protein [uncultured Fretibacterium sp.]|uniref:hypothetical protein n=1 Tax=uncultured Fretibacterium sp. TaxID=1678694 RepID=UPI0026072FAC|nr:hypothetical protein [uncultured Fretibacterium sp.]